MPSETFVHLVFILDIAPRTPSRSLNLCTSHFRVDDPLAKTINIEAVRLWERVDLRELNKCGICAKHQKSAIINGQWLLTYCNSSRLFVPLRSCLFAHGPGHLRRLYAPEECLRFRNTRPQTLRRHDDLPTPMHEALLAI